MILILGGTSDALQIAEKLFKLTPNIIYSTATEYGSQVSERSFLGTIINGRMDRKQLIDFCRSNNIKTIIDATHPYADKVSDNAMKASKETGIDYIRYERKTVISALDKAIICESYDEAGKQADKLAGTIFITTGSKDIDKIICNIQDLSRVRARILPMSEAILKLEDLKLNSDSIIAMKGPFSEEMNYLMFKESQARVLICKDSGKSGGTDEKIAAAQRLGMQIIVIKRPSIEYTNYFQDISDLIDYFMNNLME